MGHPEDFHSIIRGDRREGFGLRTTFPSMYGYDRFIIFGKTSILLTPRYLSRAGRKLTILYTNPQLSFSPVATEYQKIFTPSHFPPYIQDFISFQGYETLSSFLRKSLFLFFVVKCSAHTSFVFSAWYLRMNRGSHSSLATPRSLQQRVSALDLHPSAAVGMPSGEK